MKVLCSAPFNSLTINPDKSVVPCCAWDNREKTLGNLVEDSLTDILNGRMLKELQEDMLNYKWHKGCSNCKKVEENIGTSTRTMLYNRLFDYDGSKDIKILEFNSSNTCNLACITCGPFYSSYWVDYINKGSKHLKESFPIIPKNYKIDENYFKQIDFSKLEKLVLKGGEPFLNKSVLDLLKHLDELNYLKNIIITIVTNGTVYDEKIFEYLKKAKHLGISVSIDAYGELNEWIRYSHNTAASITKIHCNLIKLLDFTNLDYVHLSAVVSAYNIFYLRELQTWWNENILPISNKVEPANFPHIIVSSQLPSVLNLTQKSIDYLHDYYTNFNDKSYDTVIKLLTNKYLGNEKHNKFVNFTLMYNNNRNIDIFKVAPKLVNELVYINE